MMKRYCVGFVVLLLSLSSNVTAQNKIQDSNDWVASTTQFLSNLLPDSDSILVNHSEVELKQHSAMEVFATVQSLGFSQNPRSKVTIKALIGSSSEEATEHYGHMFEPFELEGFYLRNISFADADRASETNMFGDGTTTVTWQKGAILVQVQSVYGCKTLALRVHRGLEEQGLYKSFFAVPPQVVAVISGMVTSLDGDLVKLEFETHEVAEPQRGDQVEFSKLVQGITVKSGAGQVVESGLGYAVVNVTSGKPELMHRGKISATGNRGIDRVAFPDGELADIDYPGAPLDVAKAFLQLLFDGDTERIGRYINPSERAEALEMLRSNPDEEYLGQRLDQYTFGEVEIDGEYASIMAQSPGVTEMEQIGMLIRVDGSWYISFGMETKTPVATTKQVLDKDGQWVFHIPEDWIEDSIGPMELTIFRPSHLDEYQVHVWIQKLEDDQASGTPEDLLHNFPTSEKYAVQFEDGPRYAELAGYTKALYAHLTGENLLSDFDIPKSDERWHLQYYEVKTSNAVYACAAFCREDFYMEYQETLRDIFAELAFR